MKYRKKPVVIEAIRFGGNLWVRPTPFMPAEPELPREIGFFVKSFRTSLDGDALLIHTLEGVMRADPGDWIIRGIKGELYPCKDDIFQATYEPAEG